MRLLDQFKKEACPHCIYREEGYVYMCSYSGGHTMKVGADIIFCEYTYDIGKEIRDFFEKLK